MTQGEWLEIAGQVGQLWPHQAWPTGTVTAAWQQVRHDEFDAAQAAVAEFFHEGREYAPSPAQVSARAQQIAAASRPALPAPDVTRELTPEELGRAREMGRKLKGAEAIAVQYTYRAFRVHAAACPVCLPTLNLTTRSGISNAAYLALPESAVCDAGLPLFGAWRRAVLALSVPAGAV